MSQTSRYYQHLACFHQAGKDSKSFFFIAKDTTSGEVYPQYFEDAVDFEIELSRVEEEEKHTVIIASYNIDEDFDVQYERKFPKCLEGFIEDIAGLNRRV